MILTQQPPGRMSPSNISQDSSPTQSTVSTSPTISRLSLKRTSNRASTSTSDFANVPELLKTYSNFESFIQQQDGKQRLKEYLEKLRNGEQLVFIEVMEPIMNRCNVLNGDELVGDEDEEEDLSIGSLSQSSLTNLVDGGNNQTTTNILMEQLKQQQDRTRYENLTRKIFCDEKFDYKTVSFTRLCKMVHDQFLDDGCRYELNISSKLKKNVKKVVDNLEGLSVEEQEDAAAKAIKKLHNEVLSQMKVEVFNHLRNTEDFKVWLLSKAIEFSQKEEQIPIEDFLKENEMEENWPLFKKKKLLVMKDIRDLTEEDLRKLGIKKLGHIKRIFRKKNEHFQHE